MNSFARQLHHIVIRLCLIGVIVVGQWSTSVATEAGKSVQPSERFVSIDFNDVDINVFIKFISELTGKNFVVDDRVKGKVTILSPAKISVTEAYKVFESVLEVHGYTTVKSGRIIKVVPSPDARSKNVDTLLKREMGTPEDKVVTQLIPLKFADANEIKKLFSPLVSKNSVILAYPPTNILIVTDVYSNILRLLHILTAIDVTGIGQELSLIPIEHANAANLVKLLGAVFKKAKTAKKKVDTGQDIRFVADDRTNTIVVLASEDETVRIKALIAMIDQEVPRGEDGIRVYYLEHAVAEDLAKVLQSLSGRQVKATKGKENAPAVSEKVKITADKATNSLIISADKDDYKILEEIIAKLDIPRSMVYIEALIMEVNVDKNFILGTEWTVGQGVTVDGKTAVIGSSFETDVIGGSADTNALPLAVSSFSLGIFSETVNIGGFSFPNIQAIVQAYKRDKDVNILSTPQILTTDNEEAKIHVGKNVPFQTRTSTTDNDTFNSFEYRDVGKTLKITPQINEDRKVRLNLSLEVTELESTTEFRPTTLKRTVETTVIVDDANTVVIGGLIDDSNTVTEQKIPVLGDLPILSWLFKTESNSNTKTNLFVFLTPHVVKNKNEAKNIYSQKRDQITRLKEGNIKMYNSKWEDSVLPKPQPLIKK